MWQAAWVDTFHTSSTGIMLSEGPYAEGGASISVLGAYAAPSGPAWGWRTSFEPTGHRLLIRQLNITPAGEEGRAVETDYTRA